MRIQHNIMAMNAYRNYNTNTSALSKNLEKLSSGYKINRAGDDAAGLAISEKMRAQITGLNAAQKNVKDGISLVKTAEGAMQEIQDMLNRMDYLATQSANGTYDDDVDRDNLNKEMTALKSEINRIADSANFNGINLLDGSRKVTSTTTPGTPAGTDAIDTTTDPVVKQKNQEPTAAQKGVYTITLDGTNKLTFGTTDIDTTSNLKALGDLVVGDNGETVADLFVVTSGGAAVDLTDATTTLSADTYTLTAKAPGKMADGVDTTITGATSAGGTSAVARVAEGKDEGAGPDAKQAVYKLDFDLSKIASGQTFTVGGKTFEFSTDGTVGTGNVEIDISQFNTATTTAADFQKMAEDIQTAVSGAIGTDFKSDAPAAGSVTTSNYSLTLTADATTKAGAAGNVDPFEVSQSATASGAITGTQTVVGEDAGEGKVGKLATLEYSNFNIDKLAEGDVIKIDGVEVKVIADKDADGNNNTAKADPANKKAEITLTDAKDGTKLAQAFRDAGLKQQFNISIANNKLTVTATDVKTTADQLKAAVNLSFTPAKEAAAAGEATTTTSGGLTLQIGDTSDTWNQLTVDIGDLHVSKMGTGKAKKDGKEFEVTKTIEDISVKTQAEAQEAIYSIKNAINYVSGIRGDLGAVQNRLEHTANNLSVMAENIQDAESTIRDTDVAEEMMAYTKNNILIQSAQAMLAQANAVPQGVLQLLG